MDNDALPVNKSQAKKAVDNIRKYQQAAIKRTLAPMWWTLLMTGVAGVITGLTIWGVSRWYLAPLALAVVVLVIAQARKSGILVRFGWKNLLSIVGLSGAFALLIYLAKTYSDDNRVLVSIIVGAFVILVVYVISLIEKRYISSQ